jgi:hypothetical protein
MKRSLKRQKNITSSQANLRRQSICMNNRKTMLARWKLRAGRTHHSLRKFWSTRRSGTSTARNSKKLKTVSFKVRTKTRQSTCIWKRRCSMMHWD